MSTPATAAAVLALPDEALVPVAWLRPILERATEESTDDGLGLTVAEVAERARRAPSTIRSWCVEGRLSGARRLRGREWRIPAGALRALFESDEPVQERGAASRRRLPGLKRGLAAWREVGSP